MNFSRQRTTAIVKLLIFEIMSLLASSLSIVCNYLENSGIVFLLIIGSVLFLFFLSFEASEASNDVSDLASRSLLKTLLLDSCVGLKDKVYKKFSRVFNIFCYLSMLILSCLSLIFLFLSFFDEESSAIISFILFVYQSMIGGNSLMLFISTLVGKLECTRSENCIICPNCSYITPIIDKRKVCSELIDTKTSTGQESNDVYVGHTSDGVSVYKHNTYSVTKTTRRYRNKYIIKCFRCGDFSIYEEETESSSF